MDSDADRPPLTVTEWCDHGFNWQDQNLDRAPSEYWRRQALKRQARAGRVAAAMEAQGHLTMSQAWARLEFTTQAGIIFGALMVVVVVALFLTS